jgi:hypothetical protein
VGAQEVGGRAVAQQHVLLDLHVGARAPQVEEPRQEQLTAPPRRRRAQPLQLRRHVPQRGAPPGPFVARRKLQLGRQLRQRDAKILVGGSAPHHPLDQQRRQRQALYEPAQRALRRLAVVQRQAHGPALLLQRPDLGAHVPQVGLEPPQDALHRRQHVVALPDLVVQLAQVGALAQEVGHRLGLGRRQPPLLLLREPGRVGAAVQDGHHHLAAGESLQLSLQPGQGGRVGGDVEAPEVQGGLAVPLLHPRHASLLWVLLHCCGAQALFGGAHSCVAHFRSAIG